MLDFRGRSLIMGWGVGWQLAMSGVKKNCTQGGVKKKFPLPLGLGVKK